MAIARTVTGDVPAEELGITLPHEHFLVDLSVYVDEDEHGRTAVQRGKLREEVSLENLWWVGSYGRRWDWQCYDRWRLDDVATAVEEVERFKGKGGSTVVDVTPMSPAVGRDPNAVQEVAYRTGLNVVLGTGHYTRAAHPPDVADKSAGEIAEEIVEEIADGIDGTNVRAGIIGEIGSTEGFADHEDEKKSFRAAAIAQERTGAPITIHSTGFSHEGHDLLDVLEDAGADLTNVIVGHLDMTLRTDGAFEYLQSLADRGVYLEFDTFGRVGYLATYDRCFPLDETRIVMLGDLFDAGYEEQLLVSTDVCQKTHLTRYGGFGYDYILRDIVPRFRKRGFSQSDIDTLLVENPAGAVTFST